MALVRIVVWSAALVLGGFGAAFADDALSAPGQAPVDPHRCWSGSGRPPKWVRYYPRNAQNRNVEGRAVIDCAVTDAGTLSDCKMVSEQPSSFGFGDAALSMSCRFKVKPGSTPNGRVTLPLDFRLR